MGLAALGMMQEVRLLRFLSLVSYSFAVVDVVHGSTVVAVVVVDEAEGVVAD